MWRNGRPACRQAGAQGLGLCTLYMGNNKQLYKGLTDDLERRLMQHEQGKSPSTKKFLPVTLVHVEVCDSRKEARRIENFFKSGYGREILEEIINL